MPSTFLFSPFAEPEASDHAAAAERERGSESVRRGAMAVPLGRWVACSRDLSFPLAMDKAGAAFGAPTATKRRLSCLSRAGEATTGAERNLLWALSARDTES